ncbi:hypothetical protein HOLleu_41492 [Holothuria leucospilota]|uniref:VWFC domain-containing protein n=1 Tax=Holothuria leucospilota TaxID=206669 RepID=A0A9Q0YE88_HOLLE|nr:hypothetical protein HOLleu_41492 [Holothuria leucospilota]
MRGKQEQVQLQPKVSEDLCRACYDKDQDRWYQNGEGKPNICGSCTCINGFWSCPAYAECLNALVANYRCDAIFCPDPCPSDLYIYDKEGCQTCQCAEL